VSDCTGTIPPCQEWACDASCCVVQQLAAGKIPASVTQTDGDCQVIQCDGTSAQPSPAPDATDLPAAKDACHKGACNGDVAVQNAIAGACSFNGGSVCGDPNAPAIAGTCVACNVDPDCPPSGVACETARCMGNTCQNQSDSAGTACSGAAGEKLCDGAGTCVQCLANADCAAYCASTTCNDPIAITAGYNHMCALLQSGDVYCWGLNQVGEVGDGTTVDKHKPTKISLMKPATAVAAGGRFIAGTQYAAHTCAILNDKTLRCWGSNADGELGLGNTTAHAGPQLLTLANVAKVAVRGAHTCAVLTSGDLYCWGRNTAGQIGNGSTTSPVTTPTLITSAVASVTLGVAHTCVTKTDGKLYCWGDNTYGELGNGTTTASLAPGAAIAGLSNVTEAVTGKYTTCARNGVGVYCWGYNAGGDVGIGNTTNQTSPQALPLTGVTQLAFGDDHGGALTSAGLYMWGVNNSGQLGDGTAVNSLSPKQIPIPNLTALSFSQGSSCALNSAHQMLCWGDNTYGEFGSGTTVSSSTPVPVSWP
jgi:hypothetical protein